MQGLLLVLLLDHLDVLALLLLLLPLLLFLRCLNHCLLLFFRSLCLHYLLLHNCILLKVLLFDCFLVESFIKPEGVVLLDLRVVDCHDLHFGETLDFLVLLNFEFKFVEPHCKEITLHVQVTHGKRARVCLHKLRMRKLAHRCLIINGGVRRPACQRVSC